MNRMRLTSRHPYEASPAAVWAMFIDQEFRDRVCAATGALEWTVDIDADGQGGTVSISRTLPVGASGAVRTVVGDTVTVVQTEAWGAEDDGGSRCAQVRLEVVGQPASMRATSVLSPSESGATMAVDGDLEVRVALIGRRLERELAAAVSAGLDKEHQIGRTYLA